MSLRAIRNSTPVFIARNDELCKRGIHHAQAGKEHLARKANIALLKHWLPRHGVETGIRAMRTIENLESQP